MSRGARGIIPPEIAARGAQALAQAVAPVNGVQRALLLSEDGFEIANWQSPDAQPMQSRSLAAMASSLMAMAAAVGREIDFRNCRRLTFEADGGSVTLQAIQAEFPCILCLVLGPEAVLGRSLWAGAEVAQLMGAVQPADPAKARQPA